MIYFLLIVNAVVSAVTYIVAKWALFKLAPLELALARFTLASICYLPLLARRPLPTRRDLPGLCALGLLVVTVFQLSFLTGLSRSTSGHAVLLFALTPVFVFLLARLRRDERVTANKAVGMGLAFIGVLAVLFSRGMLSLSASDRRVLGGDLLILVSVLCWAVFVVFGKPYAERLGAVSATGWSTIAGTVIFLPVGLPLCDWTHFRELPWPGWAAVAYMAIGASIVSFLINYWAIARVEASRVAVWMNLQPVLTALLSWAIYGERLTPAFLLGGVLVMAGVTVMQRGFAPAPRGEGRPGLADEH